MASSPNAAALDGAVLVQTRRDKNRCCLLVDALAETQWDAEVLQLRAGNGTGPDERRAIQDENPHSLRGGHGGTQNAVGRLRQDVRHFTDCRSARYDVGGVDRPHLTWLLGASNKLHMQYEF